MINVISQKTTAAGIPCKTISKEDKVMRKTVISVITFFCLVSILMTAGCGNQGAINDGSDESRIESSATADVSSTGIENNFNSDAISGDSTSLSTDSSSDISQSTVSPASLGTQSSVSPAGTQSQSSVSSVVSTQSQSTVSKPAGDDGALYPVNFPTADPNRWQQKKFYIGALRAVQWSCSNEAYTKCVKANIEAGINLVTNAALSRSDMIRAANTCEKEGVDFMVYDHSPATNGFTGRVDLTQQTVKENVNEFKNYKHLMGYYVWDEVAYDDGEGGPARFPLARQHLKWFEAADPARLAFSLAFPSYGLAYNWSTPAGAAIEETTYYKYVTDYVEQVNPAILGFDYYPIRDASTKIIASPLWRDLGLLRTLSNKTGKPLWWIYQGQDMKDGTPGHLTRANLSAQMFGGIAYGCKTLIYFAGPGLVTDDQGNKSTLFDVVKALNVEVQNIGNLLLNKYSTEIYHFGITDAMKQAFFDDDLSKSKIIKDAPKNTIVSVFGDNKNKSRYVMVVNKDMVKSVSGKLTLKRGFAVEEYDKVKDKLSVLGSNISSIDMTIPAGDCVVFLLK